MFVQSAEFVKAHGGKRTDISVYGQEFTDTTWKLAKMNLALRGIEADLGERSADSFTQDLHPDLRADFVLANPPFNVSRTGGTRSSPTTRAGSTARRRRATPTSPGCSTSSTTSPRSGTAGFVLANGSLSSKSGGEGEIRRKLVEADLVDCIVAMPDKLFFNTGIPVSAVVRLEGPRTATATASATGEVLFIDARKLGRMETRRLRVLDDDDIAKIADTYHAWRNHDGGYEDVPGFCEGRHRATRSRRTTSSSRLVATSAPRRPRPTTSRSTRRSSASRRSCSPSSTAAASSRTRSAVTLGRLE